MATDRQPCTLLLEKLLRKAPGLRTSMRPFSPSPVRYGSHRPNVVASRLLVYLFLETRGRMLKLPLTFLSDFGFQYTNDIIRTWSSPLSGLITGLRPPFPTFLARFGRFTHPQLMVDEPLRVELYRLPHFCGHHHRSHVAMEASPAPLSVAPFPVPHEVDFHHFRHTKRKTPCCPAPFPGRPHSFFPNEWVEALSQCSPRSHRTSTSPCIRRVRLRLWIPFGERFSHLSSRPYQAG